MCIQLALDFYRPVSAEWLALYQNTNWQQHAWWRVVVSGEDARDKLAIQTILILAKDEDQAFERYEECFFANDTLLLPEGLVDIEVVPPYIIDVSPINVSIYFKREFVPKVRHV